MFDFKAMIILNVLKCMPFIISVMVVSFVLLQLRLCQQFYKPLFSGVQNLAVRSGYQLKPGIKHSGLGAIKLLFQKVNKGFGSEVLQRRNKCIQDFNIQVLLENFQTRFCMEKKNVLGEAERASQLLRVGTNYHSFEELSFAYLILNNPSHIARQLSDIGSTWKFNKCTFCM